MVKDIVCVVIFLGANDCCKAALKPDQHVPVKEYKENLNNMVEYLQSIGVKNKQIILVSLPAFVEEKWQQLCLETNKVFGKSNADGAMYYEACKAASNERGTEFVDLYNTMMSEEKWQTYLSDGLHFSVSGGQFVADKIWPLIEKTTKSLSSVLPQWDTVDNGNPGTTFDSFIKKTHIH